MYHTEKWVYPVHCSLWVSVPAPPPLGGQDTVVADYSPYKSNATEQQDDSSCYANAYILSSSQVDWARERGIEGGGGVECGGGGECRGGVVGEVKLNVEVEMSVGWSCGGG